MNKSIKQELVSIVGPDRATDRPEDLVAHSYDAHTEEHLPDFVLFPLSTEEVSSIMKVAFRKTIPVTARGSGTNLAGGSVPLKGGIVLALSRMDKILEIDPENRIARVQPGVINFDLQLEVDKFGLMYPPDPSSWKIATMGGTVGTNAGGPRTLKYGVTRDYLLGLTAVLADGTVLKTGGRAAKSGDGYDLTGLLCGSEGTLGIITEITVRLVPKPQAARTIRADFALLEDSSDAVAAIIGTGIVPSRLELMDKVIIRAVEADRRLGLPADAEAILLIEVDGDPVELEHQLLRIREILKDKRASGVIAAADDREGEMLWTARRAVFSVMARLRPNTMIEDASVPVSRLTEMIRKVIEIADRHDLQVGVLAHAGDGNLHPNLLFDQRDREEVQRVDAANEEIARAAVSLGGTLSGEHGIGMAKARLLPLALDSVALDVTRSIKQCLDPKGILNPGKFV